MESKDQQTEESITLEGVKKIAKRELSRLQLLVYGFAFLLFLRIVLVFAPAVDVAPEDVVPVAAMLERFITFAANGIAFLMNPAKADPTRA